MSKRFFKGNSFESPAKRPKLDIIKESVQPKGNNKTNQNASASNCQTNLPKLDFNDPWENFDLDDKAFEEMDFIASQVCNDVCN